MTPFDQLPVPRWVTFMEGTVKIIRNPEGKGHTITVTAVIETDVMEDTPPAPVAWSTITRTILEQDQPPFPFTADKAEE